MGGALARALEHCVVCVSRKSPTEIMGVFGGGTQHHRSPTDGFFDFSIFAGGFPSLLFVLVCLATATAVEPVVAYELLAVLYVST